MKTMILLVLTLLSITVKAQSIDDFPDMRSWGIYYSDTLERYIYADTAYIRISPDTKQPPIDTLLTGDNILITGASPNSLTIRGLKGPWLKIKYSKNGEERNGYIWQGLVSCTPLRRGDTKFVFGIERKMDSSYIIENSKQTFPFFQVRLKVVQNGTVISRAAFATPNDESANFSEGKVMSGLGLTNVQNMVVLSFNGAACGVPSLDYYFAFTKNNSLVRFPDKTNVGDAGVYYHSETFIFPSEKNGKPDQLIWNLLEEEETEKTDKNGEPIMKVTAKKNKTWVWDHQKETITELKK
ncbi:MAG: hypothetical protein J7578_25575 [Chitinophagaceae bacterium]|nr:hypothetical protein [Chitinophagaceae bacterium]